MLNNKERTPPTLNVREFSYLLPNTKKNYTTGTLTSADLSSAGTHT